jgi:hypothetical protein
MGSRRTFSAVAMSVLVLAACTDSDDDTSTVATGPSVDTAPVSAPTPPTVESTATSTTAPPAPTALLQRLVDDIAAAPAGCDPLDPRQCVLPFPSDGYAERDTSTDTGLRVAIPDGGLPSNVDDTPIDVTAWNELDGFTPNASILTYVADLDPEASRLPSWTDLEASLADDSTVVIVDTATGERIPLWAELDAKAADDDERLLVIHPAVVLDNSTTYAVALRGLVTTSDDPVEPSAAFEIYRDALTTDVDVIEFRRDDMEAMFGSLGEAGIARDDLQLAWTFTTASTEAITGDLVTIRDAGLTAVGDAAPEFTIDTVDEAPENPGLARFVQGSFTVPNFMTGDGAAGTSLNTDADGTPVINPDTPTVTAPFACTISATTLAGTEPAHLVSYGHGLLGSHLEVDAGNIVDMANEHNAVYCATKWAGFSEDDVPTAVTALQDLSDFPTFTDRMQQGVLNHLVLGRLMLAADGLVSDPAFQRPDGTPLIDTGRLVYDGNSQGGIMGSMLAAVSTDIDRAVLGVPGINYSMLLPRSIDFDDYEAIFAPAYPSSLDRALMISVIQMVWDRSEGGGYIRNLVADPLPGAVAKPVLLHVALGDHQVTELSAMVAARSAGIPIHRPVTDDGRSSETEPGWGIDTLEYPSSGSGIVIWDSNAALIPIEQLPPRVGEDPHGDPRNDAAARAQKASFLFDEQLIDVCGGAACRTAAQLPDS